MISRSPTPNSLRICLFEPTIPQNTGSIASTSAAFNLPLDLIKPLGFSLDDRYLKRAGLDYWPYVDVNVFESLQDYIEKIGNSRRIIGSSRYGGIALTEFNFKDRDILLFGRESSGVPDDLHKKIKNKIKIKLKKNTRSLNVAIAVAIVSSEALRQNSCL